LGTLTYQWRRGTTNIGTDSATYKLEAADVGQTINVQVTAANTTGTVTSANTATIARAAAATPNAPTMGSNTQTSITLTTIANGEYRCDGGAWQTSSTFSGLTANMSYSFTQRITQTATHSVSPASVPAIFSTQPTPKTCEYVFGIKSGVSTFGTASFFKITKRKPAFVLDTELAWYYHRNFGIGVKTSFQMGDAKLKINKNDANSEKVKYNELLSFIGLAGHYRSNDDKRFAFIASAALGGLNWKWCLESESQSSWGFGGFCSAGLNWMATKKIGFNVNVQSLIGVVKDGDLKRNPIAIGVTGGLNYKF
jgi:hypothetical protein